MFVLLPPSETKRVSIQGSAFNASDPELFLSDKASITQARAQVRSAYWQLLSDFEMASRSLKLGKDAAAEHLRLTGPASRTGIPAGIRYDGTLYKALGQDFLQDYAIASSKPAPLRILVQSALFGLVDLLDRIPYYRLSHNTSLPQSYLQRSSLRSIWASAYRTEATFHSGVPILDFRSAGYRELCPLDSDEGIFVVAVYDSTGERSLNHFNKKHKGEFVSAITALWNDSPSRVEIADIVYSAAEKAKLGVDFQGNLIRLRVLGSAISL